MAEAKTLLGHCATYRLLSECPCVEFSGDYAGNLMVLVQVRLAHKGAAILLETSDA